MVTDLLKLYGQRNGVLPNKIVFYRDGSFISIKLNVYRYTSSRFSGVDDGFFQTVLNKEVRTLKNATRGKLFCSTNHGLDFTIKLFTHNFLSLLLIALYMNNPLPSITFIVVKKRHNTRFFLRNANGYISNVSPGSKFICEKNMLFSRLYPKVLLLTLESFIRISLIFIWTATQLCKVDLIIFDSKMSQLFCFTKGTSHPCHYHVLYDEIGFSSDEIQALTYYLCHTDVRCTKAVSIPAPIHYAHLAAYQSRNIDSSINTNNRPTAS